jgi:hypothetical protein
VARNRSVGHLGWAGTDVDHVADAATALTGAALWFAHRAPTAQALMQITAQLAPALHVEGLIDGLVRHPHLRFIGEVLTQPCSDLRRAVQLV